MACEISTYCTQTKFEEVRACARAIITLVGWPVGRSYAHFTVFVDLECTLVSIKCTDVPDIFFVRLVSQSVLPGLLVIVSYRPDSFQQQYALGSFTSFLEHL